jgi:hypothetical protein
MPELNTGKLLETGAKKLFAFGMDKLKTKVMGDVSPTAAGGTANLDSDNMFSIGASGAPEFNTGKLAEEGAKKLFSYGMDKFKQSISGNVTPKAGANKANLDNENIFSIGTPDISAGNLAG